MNKSKISVIIPTWNGKEYLKICLNSLRAQTNKNFEIIIVDNGSTDGTIQYLEENFPKVNIIELRENIGFAAAVNVGIKHSKNNYIFLLNNDIELDKNCINEVYEGIQHNKADVFMCRMMDFYNRNIVLDAGNTYSIYGHVIQEERGKRCDRIKLTDKEIFSACAGAAIYNKNIFEKIGYFDELFFAYLEDVDMGFRIQLAGYKTFLLSSAIVYHMEGGTSNRVSDFKEFYSNRNSLYLIFKNLPLSLLFFLFPSVLLYQLRTIVYFIKKNKVSILIKVYIDFIKNIFIILKKRREIQKNKKVSNMYIFKKLSKKNPFRFLEILNRK